MDIIEYLIGEEDVYPYSHTFTEAPFAGLTIHYRELPSNLMERVAAEVEAPLTELGFDPLPTVHQDVFGGSLEGSDLDAYEFAKAKLSAKARFALGKVLSAAFVLVISSLVGSWSAAPDVRAAMPRVIERYPSFGRAVVDLAASVSLSTEKAKRLGK